MTPTTMAATLISEKGLRRCMYNTLLLKATPCEVRYFCSDQWVQTTTVNYEQHIYTHRFNLLGEFVKCCASSKNICQVCLHGYMYMFVHKQSAFMYIPESSSSVSGVTSSAQYAPKGHSSNCIFLSYSQAIFGKTSPVIMESYGSAFTAMLPACYIYAMCVVHM